MQRINTSKWAFFILFRELQPASNAELGILILYSGRVAHTSEPDYYFFHSTFLCIFSGVYFKTLFFIKKKRTIIVHWQNLRLFYNTFIMEKPKRKADKKFSYIKQLSFSDTYLIPLKCQISKYIVENISGK